MKVFRKYLVYPSINDLTIMLALRPSASLFTLASSWKVASFNSWGGSFNICGSSFERLTLCTQTMYSTHREIDPQSIQIVITIQIWFELTRFRMDFSACLLNIHLYLSLFPTAGNLLGCLWYWETIAPWIQCVIIFFLMNLQKKNCKN